MFSDKSISGDQIKLTEKGEYVKTEVTTAEFLNSFFFKIVKDLSIPRYSNYDHIIQNIKDLTLRKK